MMQMMIQSFDDEFEKLKKSEDLDFLRKELQKTKCDSPECTIHMMYLNNKIGVISSRIKELEKSLHEVFG